MKDNHISLDRILDASSAVSLNTKKFLVYGFVYKLVTLALRK